MSGPKDFSIEFSPLLIEMFASQRVQHAAAFAERVQVARQAPRRRPAPRAPIQSAITNARSEAVVQGQSAGALPSATTPSEPAADETARITAELAAVIDAIVAHRAVLAEEAGLLATCRDSYAKWTERCSKLGDLPACQDALREARDALAEGELLVAHVLDVSEQVERRRHVQKAILESFHAIGFFTDIVETGDGADATKPITIVARKGTEEVSVSLPLGDAAVQSRWAGQTDERCVDAFFDYVAQMGKRGMECRPERNDLADRPKLRQAGRKDLPRSQSEGR